MSSRLFFYSFPRLLMQAVCDALNVSSSVVSAGLAASNCMCIIFFSFIFYLGGPPVQPSVEKCGFQRSGKMTQAARSEQKNAESSSADFKEVLYALSTSSVLCAISNGVARHLGKPGWTLWIVSLLTVMIASVYPAGLARLKAGGEILASVFLQMFFCVVGLSAHIPTLLSVGPQLFLFSIVQIAIHLSIVLAVWSLSGKISKREALVASNAAVGGAFRLLPLTLQHLRINDRYSHHAYAFRTNNSACTVRFEGMGRFEVARHPRRHPRICISDPVWDLSRPTGVAATVFSSSMIKQKMSSLHCITRLSSCYPSSCSNPDISDSGSLVPRNTLSCIARVATGSIHSPLPYASAIVAHPSSACVPASGPLQTSRK